MGAGTVTGSNGPSRKRLKGFTLIELMVVMTIVALLIAVAVPRYFHSVDKARESTLRHDLNVMREAIDKFYGDHERYPASLEELVSLHYLRAVPPDPITGSRETWVLIAPEVNVNGVEAGSAGAVYDIRSGAPGNGRDGTAYAEW
ncbi:type II secretion system protein G (GspG) [Methylovorus glucosotrophus]|uniref:type II secretion system protein n=1 Tax=Methylovorus glucosotrophus TaxID=266009 RepID=UPI001331447A|nr:prepilin-type N-terminal cleavage/methylation domain-containing protein [Methylovorus glucosotrophus]KAF0844380.1 type II secretion system protein G (GspG) [Methylovorus glucosotrophus]